MLYFAEISPQPAAESFYNAMSFSPIPGHFFLKSDSGLKSILEAANHNLKGLKCAKHNYLVMAYPDNALKIFLVSDMKVNVREMVLSR